MIQLLEGGTYLVNGTELVEPAKAAAQGLPAPGRSSKTDHGLQHFKRP